MAAVASVCKRAPICTSCTQARPSHTSDVQRSEPECRRSLRQPKMPKMLPKLQRLGWRPAAWKVARCKQSPWSRISIAQGGPKGLGGLSSSGGGAGGGSGAARPAAAREIKRVVVAVSARGNSSCGTDPLLRAQAWPALASQVARPDVPMIVTRCTALLNHACSS